MTRGSLTILQLTHQGGPAGSTQSIFDLGQHLARRGHRVLVGCRADVLLARLARDAGLPVVPLSFLPRGVLARSEEHTSELQSQSNLVCRLLLEKKKNSRLPSCLNRGCDLAELHLLDGSPIPHSYPRLSTRFCIHLSITRARGRSFISGVGTLG